MSRKCCDKIILTPFCPYCGTHMNGSQSPLIELLAYCRERLGAALTRERHQQEMLDSERFPRYTQDHKKAIQGAQLLQKKYSKWIGSLEDTIKNLEDK